MQHWLIDEDVESAESRHTAALAACDVTHEVGESGTGKLIIEGPLHQTLSIHRAIKAAAAKDAVGADSEGPSIGKRRSELALGVLLDACTPREREVFEPLCIPDHQLKSHYGFRIEKDNDGSLRWVNPLGMRYPIKPYRYE